MNRSGNFPITPILLVGLLALAVPSAEAALELKGQTECIAPSNPGGGWDAICRTTSAVLQKTGMIKATMYITNMPGGSGAVGIANVVAKRKGDTNLIVAASNALTFTMSMGRTPHT
jgi:putative tricarboxylic transport membrane protein